MSMNLYVKSNIGELGVRQTPTQITYMLLVNEKGIIAEKKGKDALQVIQAYKQWLEHSTNGVWSSSVELEIARNQVKSEVAEIEDFIRKSKVKSIIAYTL
jgi:hypothetical protein